MDKDLFWMNEAIKLAEEGMKKYGELPIATILVANDKEIGRGVTANVRENGVIAHGELFVLLEAKRKVFTCERPLVLYTTLEPCIMCLGAAIECGVDKIVYGMPALPDGGVCYADKMRGIKENIPEIVGGLMENEEYLLMKKFIATHDSSSSAWYYVNELIRQYEDLKK
ncbi:MAG: nucleoside deaminase [Clostridia bacterium]|nr:nucleoside deaminase [Clostridia bacterium]